MEVLFLAVLGLCVGSFINVLIDRIPRGQTIAWDRSRCDHCHKVLRWYELVPVFSYIVLGGRCLRCKKKLKIQYPLVESLVAGGFVALYALYAPPLPALAGLIVLFSTTVVMVVIDYRHQILPDSMIVIFFLGALLWVGGMGMPVPWMNHIISGLLAFAGLFAIWAGTRGQGMGFGDVKLAGAMGFLLGYPGIVVALYAAFLTGAAVGVILILARAKGLKSRIAFGPFLLLGAAVAFFWTGPIVAWWKELL